MDAAYGTFSARNYDIAVAKVVDDRSYHPIREFFESLPEWDGIERVDTLLIDYLGAEDSPYVRAVTRKELCAAYVRVHKPGVKFDTMIVLNGDQGIGKSTLIAKLGGEWYSDSLNLSDMNDKTAAEKLQGYWIMEIGELAGMKKADLDKVKAFISRQDDKYRASFGRRVTPHPRQCVFFGTTNSENGYLRDITGNRRFWNVKATGAGKYKPWQMTPEIVQQIARTEPQCRSRNGRIGEIPSVRRTHNRLGREAGTPRRHVLHDKYLLQGIHIRIDGVLVKPSCIVLLHVQTDPRKIRLRALKPRVRAHKTHDAVWVARNLVDTGYVGVYDVIVVVVRPHKGNLLALLEGLRPASATDEIGDSLQLNRLAFALAQLLAAQKRRKRHGAT